MVNYKYKNKFDESVSRNIIVSAPDQRDITADDMVYESFELIEALCSRDNLTFGSCESAQLKFELFDDAPQLAGKEIFVKEILDGDQNNPFIFGSYMVKSDVVTESGNREIIAYDALYDVMSKDYMEWYKSLQFPMTIKQFRDAFSKEIGIEQEPISLPNDSLAITRDEEALECLGSMVLKSIGEINACFAKIRRDHLAWVSLALTPSGERLCWQPKYETYITQKVTGLQISATNAGRLFASEKNPSNVYVVNNNILINGMSESDIDKFGKDLLELYGKYTYRPFSGEFEGNPCIEVGDTITISDGNQKVDVCILERRLKGIYDLIDSYAAKGSEVRSDEETDVTRQLFKTEINNVLSFTGIKSEWIKAKSISLGCLDDEAQDAIGSGTEGIITEFYQSDSATELSGGEWSEDPPVWSDDKYAWFRQKTTYKNGLVDYSPPVCITGAQGPRGLQGAKGAKGATGVGVESYTPYYQVGKSATTKPSTPSTTGWLKTAPTPTYEQFLWVAYLLTYTNSNTAWTEPYCVTDASVKAKLDASPKSISMSVSNSTSSASIVLAVTNQDGTTTKKTATIQMTGIVTFSDLETEGKTIIHGANIKAGTITAEQFNGQTFQGINIIAGGKDDKDGYITAVSADGKSQCIMSSSGILVDGEDMSIQSFSVLTSDTERYVRLNDGSLELAIDNSFLYMRARVLSEGSNIFAMDITGDAPFCVDYGGTILSIEKNLLKIIANCSCDSIITHNNHIQFERSKSIYGTAQDGSLVEAFCPGNGSGNVVIGYGNYSKKSGSTNIYGHDINFRIANVDTSRAFRPYYRKGDSLSGRWYGAGYVTGAGKNLTFCIPLPKPVVGDPTITVVSVDGLMVRQNGKYCYGSSASVYVNPESYTATLSFDGVLCISAIFDNTTNIVNNDALGVSASIKITFS